MMEKTNDPIPPPAAPPEAPLRGPGYDMSILQQDDRPVGATSTTTVTTKGWEAGSNHEHRQEKLRMKDIARLLQEDYNDFNQDAEVVRLSFGLYVCVCVCVWLLLLTHHVLLRYVPNPLNPHRPSNSSSALEECTTDLWMEPCFPSTTTPYCWSLA